MNLNAGRRLIGFLEERLILEVLHCCSMSGRKSSRKALLTNGIAVFLQWIHLTLRFLLNHMGFQCNMVYDCDSVSDCNLHADFHERLLKRNWFRVKYSEIDSWRK